MTAVVYWLLLLVALTCGVLIGLTVAACLQGNREARAIDAHATELVGVANSLLQLSRAQFPAAATHLEALLQRTRELRDRVKEQVR